MDEVKRASSVRDGNTAKIDHLMSAHRDCGDGSRPPQLRYLVCSSPRCGSNLVGDMLYQSEVAGDPLEYLNPRLIKGWRREKKIEASAKLSLNTYLEDIEVRRSTPNGHFGLKAHFEHLFRFEREAERVGFLRRFDRVVFLRRRDKTAQAVSLHRARVTQVWSSFDRQFLEEGDSRLKQEVAFDPEALMQALSDLIAQDCGWKSLLERSGLADEVFWYENLLADWSGEGGRLMRSLNLPQERWGSTPTLARQGSKDDPFVLRFRGLLGV